MKRWLPQLGLVVGLLIAGYAFFFSTSEEARVRELLDRLEAAVAVSEEDTNALMFLSFVRKEFAEIFAPDVSYGIAELSMGSPGRAGLAELAAAGPRVFSTAKLDLDGLELTLDESKEHALGVGTAVLDGTRRGGTPERIAREASISLDLVDGDWRIVSVSVAAPEESAVEPK